jgi:glycosyltransferase involved in cell wall biosynthesis
MKLLFIVRATLFTASGGDTQQVLQTARHLQQLGVEVAIKRTTEKMDYQQYDLLHFFNITRPADILFHIRAGGKPFVISPLLIDYSEYDKYQRDGMAGFFFRFLSAGSIEYIKTIARWAKRTDSIRSASYLWKGHQKSIRYILKRTSFVMANSIPEYEVLSKKYNFPAPYAIIPNAVDTNIFRASQAVARDPLLVICAARIEGIKNQLNLIKALNHSVYTVILIGKAAPNQQDYYRLCKKTAASNIIFLDQLPQEALVAYYQKAAVHILPSWFEICGLSSLEAAAMGCNIVITDKGYARDYFQDDAVYCDPASPDSILNAVHCAAAKQHDAALQQRILHNYTWQQTAAKTLAAYKSVLDK